MSLLKLQQISVAYGKNLVLKDLNLNIEQGELVSLLGPSGCGKTTTLRTIAGFIDPVKGKFIFKGQDYTHIPAHKRNFGFVFQSYALFPHLSVFDNIAFGLKLRKIPREEITDRVKKILNTVDLTGFENRYPRELSGGQQQRVALARSLVINPDLLLLDEPLSNLDAKLRTKMRVEIRKIQQDLNITTVYVTHDQEECFSISDKVAIMNKGIIEQLDSPEKIYHNPKTEFVAKFVGYENFIQLEKVDGVYRTESGHGFEIVNTNNLNNTQKLKAAIRPEEIIISTEGGDYGQNIVKGQIHISTFLGKEYQYVVNTDLGRFLVNSSTDKRYKDGQNVILHFPANKLVLVK